MAGVTGAGVSVRYQGAVPAFSPLALFSSGEQGAWYDPSDFSTLFENSDGTGPITTLERPVGLMADKRNGGTFAVRKNLVQFSEQFDNAAWTKTRMRAFGSGSVANTSATTDPLGTNTADYIQQEAGQTVFGGVFFNVSLTAGTTRTASIYAKKAEKNFLVILSNVGADRTWFNLDTGAVGTTAASHIPSIQSIGNGWYRCSIATSTEIRPNFYGADTDGSTTVTDSGGIYIWGAQLEVGSSATTYQPTTTWPTSWPAGNHAFSSLTARPALRNRYNLLTFSEEFDNAAWAKASGASQAVTVTANSTTAPDGTTTADTITETTVNVFHSLFTATPIALSAATVRTFSVYVKKDTATYAQLNFGGSTTSTNWVQCVVDLDTGSITQSSAGAGGSLVSATSTSVGSGWYRVALTGSLVTDNSIYCYVGTVTGATPTLGSFGVESRVGNTSNRIFAWGAQLIATNSLASNAYQRIAAAPTPGTAPTYDTDLTKFPPYLFFDGVDDWLNCDSIVAGTSHFEGANAPLSIFAGARRETTGSFLGVVAFWGNTLTASENDNLGLSYAGTTGQISANTRNFVPPSTFNDKNITAGTNAAPETGILTWVRTTTTGQARYNGVAGTAADQTQPALALVLGSIGVIRRGSGPQFINYLNGNLYSLIIRGAESTATQITDTENWIDGKLPT